MRSSDVWARPPIALAVTLLVSVSLMEGCGRDSVMPSKITGNEVEGSATEATSETLPAWTLSEDDSALLGDVYSIAPFEFRPPANFRFIKIYDELATGSATHLWVGPIRADETYPLFTVTACDLTADNPYESLEHALLEVMGAIQGRRENWVETPVEKGTIDGVPFIRATWSGNASSAAREGLAGLPMHGVVYLTIHNNKALHFMCQDTEPDHETHLPQGQAAVKSLRLSDSEEASRELGK